MQPASECTRIGHYDGVIRNGGAKVRQNLCKVDVTVDFDAIDIRKLSFLGVKRISPS